MGFRGFLDFTCSVSCPDVKGEVGIWNRRSQLSSYGRPSAMFIPFGLVARIIGHWLSLIGQNVGTLSFLRTRRRPARIYLVIYRTSTHMCVLIWKSPSRCMQMPCWEIACWVVHILIRLSCFRDHYVGFSKSSISQLQRRGPRGVQLSQLTDELSAVTCMIFCRSSTRVSMIDINENHAH